MKKVYSAALMPAVLFLVLGILLTVLWRLNRPEPQITEKTISVEVIHSDGTEKTFSFRTEHGYLGNLLLEEGLISGQDNTVYGLLVDTVDGETADYEADGSWWQLLINGAPAPTAVDGVTVTFGTVYTWVYTTDEPNAVSHPEADAGISEGRLIP